MEFKHEPVMLRECLQSLNIKPDGVYVDGTLGGAGHSYEIASLLSNNGLLVGIDRDKDALEASKLRLSSFQNVKYVWGKYEDIKEHLLGLEIEGVDGILLDLGISSYQIDEPTRGFSYTKDAPLDMRMNREQELTAKQVVNMYSKENLERIFKDYGEEKFSKKIAGKIVFERNKKEIETTYELVDIIRSAVPVDAINSFKRIFQAIRIEVNGELRGLEQTVRDAVSMLNDGGRLCIITFHSLEDRIIKNVFNELEGRCTCPKDFPKCVCGFKSFGKVVTKKPILPSLDEQERNSRAKSAKLRVFEKICKKF